MEQIKPGEIGPESPLLRVEIWSVNCVFTFEAQSPTSIWFIFCSGGSQDKWGDILLLTANIIPMNKKGEKVTYYLREM